MLLLLLPPRRALLGAERAHGRLTDSPSLYSLNSEQQNPAKNRRNPDRKNQRSPENDEPILEKKGRRVYESNLPGKEEERKTLAETAEEMCRD
jgi:hypothetical protein